MVLKPTTHYCISYYFHKILQMCIVRDYLQLQINRQIAHL